MNYRKLNSVTKIDYFPLQFTDTILDEIAGYDCYSSMDGFSKYNWILIYPPHRIFAYACMPFDMCNFLGTFFKLEINTFWKYLHRTMEVFLDDFAVYSTIEKHAKHLQKCFDECMVVGIYINIATSVFLGPFGKLIGHIISKQGLATNPKKIAIIASLPNDSWDTRVIIVVSSFVIPSLLCH